jgi:hypothetical protein
MALESLPPDDTAEAEPYFSLWSALCHQGDVYFGSYAAVPHIVRVIGTAPDRTPWTLFQMVACIEISRANGRGPEIPADLRDDYAAALAQIPALVGAAAKVKWDDWYAGAALAAIAASKGLHRLAEAVLELDPDSIEAFLDRKFNE